MTAIAAPAYRIIAADDEHGQRIIAATLTGVEIAGAQRPHSLNDWRVYVTKFAVSELGAEQPHRLHACSRADALKWVEMVAKAVTMAGRLAELEARLGLAS